MKNRIALVTGGIGGLGTAICRHLNALGAQVIATDKVDEEKALQWQRQQEQAGFDFSYRYVDVTQFANCQTMIADIEKRLGSIDILVNNVGIIQDVQFYKMTKEQWQSVIDTDLDSVFNVTRNVVNGMMDRGYGRIINISSVSAQKGQFAQTNYAAAKAGLHGFTKSLAQEVAKKGITVNTVSPGYIATGMTLSVREDIMEKIIAQIPVGRLGEPEEIARMVGFLAAEESAFITGANFSVNGGLHMY